MSQPALGPGLADWLRGAIKTLRSIPRIWLVVGLCYGAGYACARDTHMIIHAKGFGAGASGPEIIQHRVRIGDVGIPLLNPIGAVLIVLSGQLYAPLMFLETLCWYAVAPRGSPTTGYGAH